MNRGIYKKRLSALCTALLAAGLLCGCMPHISWIVRNQAPAAQSTAPDSDGTTPQFPDFTLPTPGETDTPATVSRHRQDYGSVGLLREPTVLVSVFVNDAASGYTWDEAATAQARGKLTLAVDWLEAQAADYGVTAQIFYDDGSEATAALHHSYMAKNRLLGGEDGDSSDETLDEFDLLCETLDTAALQETYGTENIGFLLFLPLEGCSFTMVHYTDDGPYYVEEYSCLYRYDMYSDAYTEESPSVYAHEILHLFGAPDLYEGSSDAFVSKKMVAYMEETYPDEIMFDTYNPDGSIDYDAIRQRISPPVAYRLGLTGSCDELTSFPALSDTQPGTFSLGETQKDFGSGDWWPDYGGGSDIDRLPTDLGVACRPARRLLSPA